MLKKFFNPESKKPKEKNVIMRYSGMGLEFAVSFGLFVFGGLYLDKKMDSSPIGIIIGAFLGFGVALYQLIKNAQEMEKDIEEEEKEERQNKEKK